jgi:hypothetical protein
MVVGWTRRAGSAIIPPLLVQPVDVTEVANELVDAATSAAAPGRIGLAGPRPEDLVDMARRTLRARGENLDLVPSWQGPLGPDMAGEVLATGTGRPPRVEDFRRVACRPIRARCDGGPVRQRGS